MQYVSLWFCVLCFEFCGFLWHVKQDEDGNGKTHPTLCISLNIQLWSLFFFLFAILRYLCLGFLFIIRCPPLLSLEQVYLFTIILLLLACLSSVHCVKAQDIFKSCTHLFTRVRWFVQECQSSPGASFDRARRSNGCEF